MAKGAGLADCRRMMWKNIRLELAKTDNFPRGSPSRAYLLRLPLGADGGIDKVAVHNQPRRATVRRFWPSEPDMAGYAIPAAGGLDLAYDPCPPGWEIGKLESDALRLGDCVVLTEPDGTRLPFRVAALDALS